MSDDSSRLRDWFEDPAPLNWIFTGDSITHGLIHTQGARSYPEHLHELIRGDMGRVHDAVINTAISGWRIPQLLDDFDRRVAVWQPHIVALMIGTNDCSTDADSPQTDPEGFAASVTEFVRRVRELHAIPVLQTPPSIDVANAPERSRVGEFAAAIRQVAEEQQTVLVDQFARFDLLGAGKPGGVAWGLLDDPFHPNEAGHAALALGIAQTLGLGGTRVTADLHARIERAS